MDLEQLRVAMANSDKINSSSSLNYAPSANADNNKKMINDIPIDDVLRQFDSLNSASVVGTNHATNKRINNSKCCLIITIHNGFMKCFFFF